VARRRIGPEQLRLGSDQSRRCGSLDEIAGRIDWAGIDRHLVPIYAAPKGEPAWPPLARFKALRLAVWYDLSDVKLAEARDDRASFRRFCGFAQHAPTPERTAFVRFRRELVARALDPVRFAAVTGPLDGKGVGVRTGPLIDAPVIAAATAKAEKARLGWGPDARHRFLAPKRRSPPMRTAGSSGRSQPRRRTSAMAAGSPACGR
jgi:transposase, IS5 family